MAEQFVPEPDRLTESPPADCFCDIVLTGGVASGVVYPWAIVELARHYHFKSIGGSSVGAVAASLTAASEYGRRKGIPYPFEVLRRVPLELAKPDANGDTTMLRLFQPNPSGKRLFSIFVQSLRSPRLKPSWLVNSAVKRLAKVDVQVDAPDEQDMGEKVDHIKTLIFAGGQYKKEVLKILLRDRILIAVVVVILAFAAAVCLTPLLATMILSKFIPILTALQFVLVLSLVLVAAGGGAWLLFSFVKTFFNAILGDIQKGIADNFYGLCTGLTQAQPDKNKPNQGFNDWLHEGIQKAAGLEVCDAPLTFADLWHAPALVGEIVVEPPSEPDAIVAPPQRSIDLQMFTSNLTHGMPLKLPFTDLSARLFYDPSEWQAFFPEPVMSYLQRVSKPYVKLSEEEPDAVMFDCNNPSDPACKRIVEIPIAQLPVLVATRMSMSFPILFSAIPVYSINFGNENKSQRVFGKCYLSDGGISSNFPIQLFDSPVPRWPTFGLYLDQRIKGFKDRAIVLPKWNTDGGEHFWNRFVPDASSPLPNSDRDPFKALIRVANLLRGVVATALDRNDRVNLIAPHVRNRVVRLALEDGEGQLNIAMSQKTILNMAHKYGTQSGLLLAGQFKPEKGVIKPAWKDHLYVRSNIFLAAMRRYLSTFGSAIHNRAYSLTLPQLLGLSLGKKGERALEPSEYSLSSEMTAVEVAKLWQQIEAKNNTDPMGRALSTSEVDRFNEDLLAIERLQQSLKTPSNLPFLPAPQAEIRLRTNDV